jgi:1-deoxy-D-xylulose-5-phosphate reductoisomerase
MGPVVSVNSATLMNKGLELIEAHLLFDVPWTTSTSSSTRSRSCTRWSSSSTARRSRSCPPRHAAADPARDGLAGRLDHAFVACDWTTAGELTFEPVDRRPSGARPRAGGRRRGGAHPAVYNAANEVAVTAFLAGGLGFLDITAVVAETLEAYAATDPSPPRDLDDVWAVDRFGRDHARAAVHRSAQR